MPFSSVESASKRRRLKKTREGEKDLWGKLKKGAPEISQEEAEKDEKKGLSISSRNHASPGETKKKKWLERRPEKSRLKRLEGGVGEGGEK